MTNKQYWQRLILAVLVWNAGWVISPWIDSIPWYNVRVYVAIHTLIFMIVSALYILYSILNKNYMVKDD